MEERIRSQVETLVKEVRERGGETFDPQAVVTACVLNVIMSIAFGNHFEPKDLRLVELVENVHQFIIRADEQLLIDFFKPLRFLPYFRQCLRENTQLQDNIFGFIERAIEDGRNCDSFVNRFIEHEGPGHDHQELLFILRDLLLAGTETTSATTLWALIILANNPDIQRRLQEELDTAVPRDRLPSLEDKQAIPYVEATILELMRFKTIVPLGLVHNTTCDTEVGGFFISEGTMVS